MTCHNCKKAVDVNDSKCYCCGAVLRDDLPKIGEVHLVELDGQLIAVCTTEDHLDRILKRFPEAETREVEVNQILTEDTGVGADDDCILRPLFI